jgi:hypothetical protein
MGYPTQEAAERAAKTDYLRATQNANAAIAPREPAAALLEKEFAANLELGGNLVARIAVLADRLVGSVPSEVTSDRKAYGGNGMIDSFRASVSMQASQLDAIDQALRRMERDLG